jgi:hypothetical protein
MLAIVHASNVGPAPTRTRADAHRRRAQHRAAAELRAGIGG